MQSNIRKLDDDNDVIMCKQESTTKKSENDVRMTDEELIKKYSIIDINIEDPSLEEIISNIFES